MTDPGALATDDPRVAVFEPERARLLGLAYRLLGSRADAEDVVQEAWLRFARTDLDAIDRPAAWLTTVVGRLGLDRLRARQRERADYVGPWLPEPVVAGAGPTALGSASAAVDPAAQAELADSLTTAFLVLLEQLSAPERLALLLSDVFGESFRDIAAVLDRSEDATRQLASRARRKLRAADALDAPAAPPPAEQRAVAERLVGAVVAGDVRAVTQLLAADVVLTSDGGARVHAARRPVVGPDRVARFMINLAARTRPGDEASMGLVNQRPALIMRRDGSPLFVLQVDVVDEAVARLYIAMNPDKLVGLDDPPNLV